MSDLDKNEQESLESDVENNIQESDESADEKSDAPISENDVEPTDSSEVTEDISEAQSTDELANKKKNWFLSELVDYIEIFVVAICSVILLFSFAFRLCTVDGESMENTLFEKETLIVSDLFYTPEREDIIVFHQTGELNEPIVKRVIATEGETVNIEYDNVKVSMTVTVTHKDGTTSVLDEDYIKYEGYSIYQPTTVTVPEGYLFVMGDNRNNSKDSRDPDIGLVDSRRVMGKVIFRLSPIDKFGTVE